jgi:hypothetical protein
MTKLFIRSFLSCTAAVYILLHSCSGLKITRHYDEEADFTRYKTFFLLPTDPVIDVKVNRYDKELLLRSIADEMKARGYQQQEANGDLSVNMFVILDDQTGYTNYTSFYTRGGWGYYYPFGYGYAGGNYQYTVTKGTLIIDVFDHRGKKLLWQGVGIGTVQNDPVRRQENIPRVVDKIFRKFPVARNNP